MPGKTVIRVHLIFNAHLDPAWLWPWEAGLDAALATFRSACDLLDAYPELTFAAGDVWTLAAVERVDEGLFARLKAHVASRRWSVYGGWWVQPDCNFPTKAGFERQISLGRDFCLSRFGKFSEVARNVDSFGHSAALPELLRAAGQPNYIMMRPEPHELRLPARIFHWRGHPDTPAALTFRLTGPYCWRDPGERSLVGHILDSMAELPEGVNDTMCFLGVGDHGGGPTRALVDSCLRLKDAIPGTELLFSTPERFFAALRQGDLSHVPEVAGELQHHAVGCYTLQRKLKLGLKRAERLLECLDAPGDHPGLERAWRTVCFNQFHDILGGTCLPAVQAEAEAQVGGALAFAEEKLKLGLRRAYSSLPDAAAQRIVLQNPSDTPFAGLVEFSPWLEAATTDGAAKRLREGFKLLDEDGVELPSQRRGGAMLFHAALGPKALKTVSLVPGKSSDAREWKELSGDRAVNRLGFGLALGAPDAVILAGVALPAPRLELLDDPSDTWTHNFDRYLEGPAETPVWNDSFLLGSGPVAAGLSRSGRLGAMELREDFLVRPSSRFYELGLRVGWFAKLRVLKLVLPFKAKAVGRVDGVASGRGLERRLDGAERPLHDWMLFELEDGSKVGVVCPDVFAADANEFRVRLTLLRSPLMANHAPALPASVDPVYSDHGPQSFRIGFDHSPDVSEASLAAQALAWLRPPLCGDLTKGMPPKFD